MLMRVVSLFSLLLLCVATQAASEIFMKVDGIPGDSTDDKHKNEIVLANYAYSFFQTGATSTGGGGGVGRLTVTPFTVTKFIDSSSPRLALACASGQHFRQVDIVVREVSRDQVEFIKFKLEDVTITSFNASFNKEYSANTAPIEQVQLTFAVIEMSFIPVKADGSAGTEVKMRWDVRRNAPG